MKKYKIGQIPPLTARPGEILAFQVESNLGQPAFYTINQLNIGDGPMAIDYLSGLFNFTPGPNVNNQTSVLIKAKFKDKEESQKAVINCLPRPASEYKIISADGVAPKSESRTYEQITEQDVGKAVFNNIANPPVAITTKSIVVSGVKVVFDPREKESLIKYNERKDISEMTICADEVIIRGGLKLPGTKLSIYARSLAFEDVGGVSSSITTTPIFAQLGSEMDEGINGGNAGDIYLYVKQLSMPGNAQRFFCNGGNGQQARSGQKGDDGLPIDVWKGVEQLPNIYNKNETVDWTPEIRQKVPAGCQPIYARIVGQYNPWGDIINFYYWDFGPSEKWPGDGQPPKKLPGKPGQGGSAGNIYSPFNEQLKGRVVLNKGSAGKKADDVVGAKAGTPQYSCRVVGTFFDNPLPGPISKTDFKVRETHTSKAGDEAKAPDVNPAHPKPKDGELRSLDRTDEGYWVHPLAAQAFLMFARDTFLAGKAQAVRQTIDDYLKAMRAAEKADKSSIDITAVAAELSGLVTRVDGPYDYYGNPAGWVPMLSFEANLSLYEKEIDRAMRMMYLAYWIEKNQSSKSKAATLLGSALKRMQEETKQAADDYNAATTKLTSLNQQYDKIKGDIGTLLTRLENKERDLRAKAQGDLQLQHIIRSSGKLLGGILQLIPAGQPALGAVGKGLTVLSEIDLESPLDTAPKLASALWETDLVQQKLKPKAVEYATTLLEISSEVKDDTTDDDKTKTEDEKRREEEQKQIEKGVEKKKLAEKVKAKLAEEKEAKKAITDALSSFSVPEKEVTAELERLKAACPEYTKLADDIKALGKEKTAFAEQILAVVNTLEECANTVLKNALADIEMRSQLTKTLDRVNNEARQYARAMGQQARDRMIKYHYYLVKSYNYLMVEPLTKVDYSAQYMIDAFAKVVSPSGDGVLSSDQYKSLRVVYEKQLTDITDNIIQFFQSNARKLQPPLSITLTPEQIKALNDDKTVTINLMKMGYIQPKEEDIRITDIKTAAVKVKNPPSTGSANVNLYYKHSGVSTIRRNGRLFLFRTGNYAGQINKGDRMFWGAAISYLDGKQTLEQMKPAESAQSLISKLLEGKSGDVGGLKQYEPSAWADIKIDRSATPSSFAGLIEGLSLTITYACYPVDDDFFTLQVQARDGVQPYIECNTADLNGSSHGVGAFLRTFNATTTSSIKLTAPERFGGLGFMGWRQSKEQPLTPDQSVPLVPLLTPEGAGQIDDISKLFKERELPVTLKASDYITVEPVYLPLADGSTDNVLIDPWPEGQPGWTKIKWLLWNDSKEGLVVNYVDYGPWGYNRWFDFKKPYELVGNDDIKVAFDKSLVDPGGRIKLTVSLNPASKLSATEKADKQMIFGNQDTYRVILNGMGKVISTLRYNRTTWTLVPTTTEVEVDYDNRLIRFRGF